MSTCEATEASTSDTPAGARNRRGPFVPGDRVQLTDPKGKLHTIMLTPGKTFHTHRGAFSHDELIGQPEGIVVHSTSKMQFLALRPLLSDNVLSMPRGAAVVYPKDAGHIVAMADIFPGARVIEAGVGSGALSMSLLRAVGDQGLLHSFERRDEFAKIAQTNVSDFFGGPHPAWKVTVGDLQDTLPAAGYTNSMDRCVLDMLAPWECLDAVADALTPGGVIICYVATVTQMSRLAATLAADSRFTEAQGSEVMVRTWHLDGLAVRPDHRMVGHTGFLVTARRMAPGQIAPVKRKKAGKDAATPDVPEGTLVDMAYGVQESGVELEHGDDYGQIPVSDRKLRRVQRKMQAEKDRVSRAVEAQSQEVAEHDEATAESDDI